MMNLPDLINKLSKDKIVLGGGIAIIGALGLWAVWKITHPYTDPVVKNICRSYLGLDSSNNPMGGREVTKIEAGRVEKGIMSKRINTVGILRANHEVMLRSEISGRIKQLLFKEGEAVKERDLLIQFEDNDLKAELEDAKADLLFREGDYQRSTKLRDQKLVSQSSKIFDESKANYDRAKARVDKAEAQVEKARILAPFSGHIGLVKIDSGEYVQPNAELVKLVDYSPIKVNFKVPEKYFHDLGVGQLAEVRLDGFANEIFIATIDAIEPSIDASSHSVAVTASIPNENERLRSGLYANISVIIGETSTLMVPESALNREGNVEYVLVVQNGKARFGRVLTGTRENGKVEIVSGLMEGTFVITAAPPHITHGASVEITNQPNPVDLLKEGIQAGKPTETKEAKKEPEKAAEPSLPASPEPAAPIVKPVVASQSAAAPTPAQASAKPAELPQTTLTVGSASEKPKTVVSAAQEPAKTANSLATPGASAPSSTGVAPTKPEAGVPAVPKPDKPIESSVTPISTSSEPIKK